MSYLVARRFMDQSLEAESLSAIQGCENIVVDSRQEYTCADNTQDLKAGNTYTYSIITYSRHGSSSEKQVSVTLPKSGYDTRYEGLT